MLLIAAAPWVPCRTSRIYTSVPRAHHWTVFCRRVSSLREAETPLAPLARVSSAGTGLTNVATEEGQGFGTLRKGQSMTSVNLKYGSLTFQQQ